MASFRGLLIPESWHKSALKQIGRLKKQPPFHLIPVPDYENFSEKDLQLTISQILSSSGLRSALIVLPVRFATGSHVRYWPDTITSTPLGYLVTSLCFSDEWETFWVKLCSYLDDGSGDATYHVTCQYQHPYTETLDAWTVAGAECFHPGDYDKKEFLTCLKGMSGHWLYWGHSDAEKLRGYRQISLADMLAHKPGLPLKSTLWFSCSTMNHEHERNVALDWYMSGATICMLASPVPVNTADNQLLGLAWLKACQKSDTDLSIADVIFHLLHNETLVHILKQYRLLGSPWVRFSGSGLRRLI